MPAAHPSLALLIVLPFVLDACGGDDLTLPGDNAPASLKVVSGDGQQGRPGELLDDPLVVQLANSHGEPTPGIVVSFSGSAGGVEVVPGLDTTDEQGRAAAQARLGQTEGEQAVEAIVVGGRAAPSRIRLVGAMTVENTTRTSTTTRESTTAPATTETCGGSAHPRLPSCGWSLTAPAG